MMANFDERLSDDELGTIVEWLAADAEEGS